MEKWFSLTIARSAKPFIHVTFWAPFFDQNRTKALSPLLEQKGENDLILRFWGAFGTKNAPERKSWPKSEKSAFGRFGLRKRAQNVTFITGLRSERKWCFFVFCFFHVFPLVGRKISFWPPKVVQNAKNAKIQSFCAFLRKWPPKYLKKYCLEQHFWPMPVLSVLERKERKSAFWGEKVRKNALFRTFWAQIAKIALLEWKIESSIEIIEIPLRL